MDKKVSKLESQNTAEGVLLIAHHQAHGGRPFRGRQVMVSREGLSDEEFKAARKAAILDLLAPNAVSRAL